MNEKRPATSNHTDPPDAALRILILEDSEFDAELILHELQQLKMPFSTRRVETREQFSDALRSFMPDLILADYSLPSFDGLTAFTMVRETQAELPFIFVSGAVGEELAIGLLKRGATDFVLKNRLPLLVPAVQRALIESNERRMRRKAEEERDSLLRELENRVQERTKALQRSETRFRLLSDTAWQLLASDDPKSIINSLCRNFMEHLDCQACFNFMVDEQAGKLRLNTSLGIPEKEVWKLEWLDYGVAVCGCAARDKTRIIAEDIFHTPDSRTELVKSFGIQAYCCHPLMVQDRLIGTLSFGTTNRTRFTPDEVELMRIVADQVAIALQRIQARQEIFEANQRLQLALDAGGMGMWAWDLQTNRTMWNPKEYELLGLPAGNGTVDAEEFFRRVHPEDAPGLRESLGNVIARGSLFQREFRIVHNDGQIRWLASIGRVIRVESGQPLSIIGINYDVTDREKILEALRESEESLRLANEQLEQRVLERTLDLQNLTAQLELSRHELRKLASELVMAEERERKRIAGVLHDEIAQTLAAVRMRLDMLRDVPADRKDKTLQEAKELLLESIQETRGLMNDLGNPLLFDLGLRAACEALADRMMERSPTRIRCDIREPYKNLDPDMKMILYQIVRELLNNVVKHSKAQNAHVRVDSENEHYRVKVTDDGVGFEPRALGAPTAEGGFGLYSMKERLIAVDGNLVIESSPGGGTMVTAILPAALE